MVFFFCPEHTFVRERKFETDLASGGSSITDVSSTENKEKVPETASVEPKRTFVQELKLYNGRFSSEGFWKLLLAPFPCMLYPATIWACLIQGTFVTWVYAHSSCNAQLKLMCISKGCWYLGRPRRDLRCATIQL